MINHYTSPVKILFFTVCLFGLLVFWYWADANDYFQRSYRDLTETEQVPFKYNTPEGGEDLMNRFRKHFFDSDFFFPRQKVAKVKLFKNIPMLGVFTGKTLKQNMIEEFLKFCNDTVNFDWGETTWGLEESEYYLRLYNADNNVIGKIYLCLEDCHMTDARPFCPAMKFGMLSLTGYATITTLIHNNDNWE